MRRYGLVVLIVFMLLAVSGPAVGGEGSALEIRAANFLVTPSTGPVTHVAVKNRGAAPLSGRIEVAFPEGWRVEPAAADFSLTAGQARPFPFTIKQAQDIAANRYPVTIRWSAGGGGGEVTQQVVCASAPFFKPKIDGNLKDWDDAIPIVLDSGGLKTVLRTYWNNQQFCLAVAVHEERLEPWRGEGKPCDAVQFALSPPDASDIKARHEFLIADTAGLFAGPRCYRLFKPGDDQGLAAERRPLKPLAIKDAQVAVRRNGKTTLYEAAIPWSLLPEIRADAGREFCFSLLVHDPGATGLRDFGEVLNRWPEDRRPNAWCSWDGVSWSDKTPYDSLSKFGFCSSIH